MAADQPPAPNTRLHLVMLIAGVACQAIAGVVLATTPAPEMPPWADGAGAWFVGRLFTFLRTLPLLLGTGLLIGAVVERLRSAGWEYHDRVETGVFTSITSAVAAGTGLFILPPDWDALRIFYGAAFVLLLSGTVLILLPATFRKIALTLWVGFHFGGMFTVFSSIDPPNGTGPWLAKQLWTLVYRPYLQVLYLTNAYHFYSPDPGPPALLWFSVQYTDGTRTWVKIPTRSKSPVGMHYQRLLALPEHTFGPTNRLGYTEAERLEFDRRAAKEPEKHHFRVSPDRVWERVYPRRLAGSMMRYKVEGVRGGLPIPVFNDVDTLTQYREPTDMSQRLISAVARRVLAEAPDRPGGAKPERVKCYRIVHQCLTPAELAKGDSPYAKHKYYGYFIGEFNTKGELLDETDYFLYWYLPIIMVPKDFFDAAQPNVNARGWVPKDGILLDCMEMHAAGLDLPRPRADEKKEGKK